MADLKKPRCRITSYNVCYTKLLRFPPDTSAPAWTGTEPAPTAGRAGAVAPSGGPRGRRGLDDADPRRDRLRKA